ncbi:hypothetical protein NDU88_004525 [Pleurodeles waltl]|uniref:Dual serine/threonine and tyrosine protein kinase n=2 Tax=Pleurodeles waltl TaxID=8319 RepID=A0AAV7QCW3_PLEWA|nr:hypothetical protein NDU88_004525 [Pleurodeles waltl]
MRICATCKCLCAVTDDCVCQSQSAAQAPKHPGRPLVVPDDKGSRGFNRVVCCTEEWLQMEPSGGGRPGPARELSRGFIHYNKYRGRLQQSLRDTKAFFREVQHTYCRGGVEAGPGSDSGQLSCMSFPSHEDYRKLKVHCNPCLLILGQNCAARCRVLNTLLGDQLLPTSQHDSPEQCKRRRIRFKHGKQTCLCLALPGQYELVHLLAAHRGKWDTIPEEDLEIHDDDQDPAHRIAELEVTLHHLLLQEVEIVVAPCRSSQSAEVTLGDCLKQFLPVVIYSISEESLSPADIHELQEIKDKFTLPIFFIRVPRSGMNLSPFGNAENERSTLYCQLADMNYLQATCCSAQSILVEQFDRLGQLSLFARQVLKIHLVDIATGLNQIHNRSLEFFINQAFDMQRDLQITPKRLEYTRQKENELFESLKSIASREQEGMKDMIVETLNNMKDELLEDAANMEFKDLILQSGEPVCTRDIKCCIQEIQELIITRLNLAVANKLISSVDSLRESCVGTLQRCLQSLERSQQESSSSVTSNHLKQILNAAYHVEVTFHSGSSISTLVWEQIKKIFQRVSWVNPHTITPEWKRKVAQDAIDSLSASKLAKNICSQLRTRLNSSHAAFAASLQQLEAGHSGRLERTEDLWLKVRKDHAPRLARLSLESRSLQDVLLYKKPKLGRELGRGQYGVVYLCDSWANHYPCALKSVVPPDDKHWNDLALEFHYMRSLPKHERLVDLLGSVIDYDYGGGGSSIAVLLIMERLHRDLYAGLKADLSLETRLQIALDVVEGIRFLHSRGLVHRDIKLKNVLLDQQDRAKITDLGFCKPEAMMSGSIVGTPIHMAPELFTGKYDNSVDVYAFGILFWYICSGSVKLPEAFERCSSKDHLWNNVKKGARPERLPVFDEECWQLMEACWNGEPSKRPLLGIVEPMLQGIMTRLCRPNSENLSRTLEDST